MAEPAQYAAALARAVALLRAAPEGGEQQKAALRALVAVAGEHSATFRFYDGELSCNETPLPATAPAFALLAERLRAHAVEEIVVARGADAAELLAMVRGLAADGGQGRIKERLRDAGSTRVMVVVETREPTRRAPSVSQAFARAELDDAVLSEWNRFLAQGGGAERNVEMGPPAEAPAEPAPRETAPSAPAQPAASARPAGTPTTARGPATPLPPPASAMGGGLPQPATLHGLSPLALAIADIERDPYGADLIARLTRTGRHIEDALGRDKVAEAIDALHVLVRHEAAATDPRARDSYGVVLKRTLTRATLTQLVPYLLEPRRAERTQAVMRRGGQTAVELLTGCIVSSGSPGERARYAEVLRGTSGGPDALVRLLSHAEWQVVRNAAEVCGEVRLEEGASYLARLLQHDDARVRRAALVALVRLGSAPAVEPLRQALAEAPPELRALVAGSIGGTHARALVRPLAAAVESEERPELVRVYCQALGRIGTAEAVQALGMLAEPGGRLLHRRPAPTRLAAVEGLRAAGPAAVAVLDRLASGGDRTVAAAAREAKEQIAGAARPAGTG